MADEIKMDGLHLQKQLQAYFAAMQDNLEQKQKDTVQALILETETLGQKVQNVVSKADLEPLSKRLTEIAEQATKMMNDMTKNQEVIDKFVAGYNGKMKDGQGEKNDFNIGWNEVVAGIAENKDAVNEMQHKINSKLEFVLKATMTIGNSITGVGVNVYNPRQGLLPVQKRNFRDLITTVPSATGLFVTYRETNAAQSAGVQTEGSAKANLQYAFTAGTSTLKYIAGYVTFTKQLMKQLPFFEGTLPRMLQRDFFRKENDYLYTTIAVAATGVSTAANPTPTVDIEEVIRMIGNQRNASFEASIGMIDWNEWARLAVTKPNDYSMPLVVTSPNNDALYVAGMPLIGASYAQTDKLLLFDTDFVERVEGESLRVEFSYENQDNFEKNLITARVECFEEVNLLRTDAVIYRDFGNS